MNKIEIKIGIDNLDEVIEKFNHLKSLVVTECEFYCMFNDTYISSLMSVDEIYKKVTGHTKSESDEFMRKAHEAYVKREKEYKEKLPELTKYYIESGKDLIRKDRYTEWCEKAVPIRLNDIYHGLELSNVLDICKLMSDDSLNMNDRISKSIEAFDDQGHSGCSASVTKSLIARFCPNGESLLKFLD